MPRKCQEFSLIFRFKRTLRINTKRSRMRSQLVMLLVFHVVSPAVMASKNCVVTSLTNCYDNVGNDCTKDKDPITNKPLSDGEVICCYEYTSGSSVTGGGFVYCDLSNGGRYVAQDCQAGAICVTDFSTCLHECQVENYYDDIEE